MVDSPQEAPTPDENEFGDMPARSQGKLAQALGVIAITLILVLGCVYLISFRRLEREVAQLNQQTQDLSRLIERAQKQSQTFAELASQAAANAQAAAQQRDVAKQEQSNSESQAQLARQQAAANQQKAEQATQQAEQATQKAEQYRQEREAQLAQLQEALGQIAETHRTALGLVMTLDSKSIRFDFDKAIIKPEYRDTLNRIAGILMTLKGYSIAVYGYTDDVGTQDYNLQLSQRRSEAVRDFLVQTGISPATITTAKGFGKADPRAPGNSEQARAANRRVEIGIIESKIITNGPLEAPK
jgi:outer membrane protein OmpA-like peptidoglycan-associated protein